MYFYWFCIRPTNCNIQIIMLVFEHIVLKLSDYFYLIKENMLDKNLILIYFNVQHSIC